MISALERTFSENSDVNLFLAALAGLKPRSSSLRYNPVPTIYHVTRAALALNTRLVRERTNLISDSEG